MASDVEKLVAALRDLRVGVELDADYVDNAADKLAGIDWAIAALTQPAASGEVVAIVGERGSVSWRQPKILPVGAPLYTSPQPDADTVRDAERYRWLRDNAGEHIEMFQWLTIDTGHSVESVQGFLIGEQIDAAIDSAIKGEK